MDNGFAEGYAVGQGNANNNGWGNVWGGDWIWAILLLALFNGGWGFGGGGYGGGNMNYELGKVATSNDVAVGFAQNATLSSLNDLKLGRGYTADVVSWFQRHKHGGVAGAERHTERYLSARI